MRYISNQWAAYSKKFIDKYVFGPIIEVDDYSQKIGGLYM